MPRIGMHKPANHVTRKLITEWLNQRPVNTQIRVLVKPLVVRFEVQSLSDRWIRFRSISYKSMREAQQHFPPYLWELLSGAYNDSEDYAEALRRLEVGV